MASTSLRDCAYVMHMHIITARISLRQNSFCSTRALSPEFHSFLFLLEALPQHPATRTPMDRRNALLSFTVAKSDNRHRHRKKLKDYKPANRSFE